MADTKLADLTALTTPSGDDILYIVDDPAGTPLDRKIALDNLFTRGTITADAPVLNMSQTWNNAAVTFTGLKFNVTDTASNASSLLMDLQVGASSRFKVAKNGNVVVGSGNGSETAPVISFGAAPTYGFFIAGGSVCTTVSGSEIIRFDGSSGRINSTSYPFSIANDVFLSRRGAANWRLGNYTGNAGSAISVSSVASNQLTLASSHGLTSGAAVIITGTTAPSGTSLNTLYYARSISAAVLELYLTFDTATATSGTTGIVAVTTAGTSASIRLATPFQTLSVQSFTGTDIPGQPFVITGSQGTGTGAGGSIIFQVAPAGSSGTVQNALSTALTIDGSTRGIILQPGALQSGGISFAGNVANIFSRTLGSINIGQANTLAVEISYPSLGLSSDYFLGWSELAGSTGAAGTKDVRLYRDAPNTLALRNGGTNASPVPQTFNQYEYWATASDYSRISLSQSSAYFFLQTQAAGSGTKRGLILRGNGTNTASFALVADELFFGTAAADYWKMSSSGHFLAGTDNLYDIGASGATRPRSVYAGTSITPGRGVTVAGLPTPSTGMIARVTDATAPVIGATVAGGGAAYALVNYNGANWTVIGV